MPSEHKKIGLVRSLFNVKRWLAIDDLVMHSRMVKQAFKGAYATYDTMARKETFAEAVQRLHLTSEDIIQRRRRFLFSAIFYLLFGLGLTGYSIYLMRLHGHLLAILLSVILALLMFVYSFREHFWYMQMQKRKLGCSYQEWLAFLLKRNNV